MRDAVRGFPMPGGIFHGALKPAGQTGPDPVEAPPMTTSEHPSVLSERELSALRLLAVDARARIDEALVEDLLAKGMLRSSWDRSLSPAGRSAIHVERPGVVLGVNN